jgi:hypothetical protein
MNVACEPPGGGAWRGEGGEGGFPPVLRGLLRLVITS